MDPLTIALLSSVGGAAVSNLGTLIPSKLQRENKKRLAELQRKQEAGQLGLTGQEQAAVERRLRGGARQAQQGAQLERERLLAGQGGAQAGASLAQAAQLEQQLMQQETDIAGKVEEMDLQKEQQQLDEMAALGAAVEERRRELAGAIGNVAGAGIQAAGSTLAQQAVIQGQKDISTAQVQGLATSLGVSPDEARGLYELSLENPEMFKYITALQSGE